MMPNVRLREELMEKRPANLDPVTFRDVSTELARLTLEAAAPDELLVFDEVADEYFDNPVAALIPARRDESLGFGLELALVAPFALAIAGEVVRFLADMLSETFRDEAKTVLGSYIRRAFTSRTEASAEAVPGERPVRLSVEQMRSVHEAALMEGRRLSLPEETTVLLGNAIVGALLVAAPGDEP